MRCWFLIEWLSTSESEIFCYYINIFTRITKLYFLSLKHHHVTTRPVTPHQNRHVNLLHFSKPASVRQKRVGWRPVSGKTTGSKRAPTQRPKPAKNSWAPPSTGLGPGPNTSFYLLCRFVFFLLCLFILLIHGFTYKRKGAATADENRGKAKGQGKSIRKSSETRSLVGCC